MPPQSFSPAGSATSGLRDTTAVAAAIAANEPPKRSVFRVMIRILRSCSLVQRGDDRQSALSPIDHQLEVPGLAEIRRSAFRSSDGHSCRSFVVLRRIGTGPMRTCCHPDQLDAWMVSAASLYGNSPQGI